MKNQIGFIPKNAPIQPDFYSKKFNAWCAVFIDNNDNEYHLQLNLDHYAFQNGATHAKSISILRQTPNCRVDATMEEYKTIKSAVERLQKLLA